MPNSKTRVSKLKIIKYVLFAIVLAVLSSLSFYLTKYSSKKNTMSTYGSHIYEDYGEKVFVVYPKRADSPGFLTVTRMGVPAELELGYDKIEQLAIPVVSTGNSSVRKIPIDDRYDTVLEVHELEVAVDDKNNDLMGNKSFNVALQVKAGPDSTIDVSPSFYDLTSEQIEIDELFKTGTKFTIVPYQRNVLYEDVMINTKTKLGYYLYILDKIYEGESSDLMRAAIDGDLSNVKNPVFVTGVYLSDSTQ